jgi:hypothetical protein
MSGRPVDLLDVLQQLAGKADELPPRLARDVREAHGAATALLAATREAAAQLEARLQNPKLPNVDGYFAVDRARAALAACGGLR